MKNQDKTKSYLAVFTAFLLLSLSIVSTVAAVGSTTLTPSSQSAGGSVTVDGTGFGATKAVGIGFGAETAGSDSNMAYTGTGMGPYSGRASYYPIKPGTFVLTSDTSAGGGLVSTYTDNGDGTLSGSFEGATGTINYVTGQWSRSTTVDVTGIATIYGATYTRYQFNSTPSGGVNTTAAGAFSAPITVPAVSTGTYNVTSIDAQGNKATAILTVIPLVPEGWSVGVMLLVSAAAFIVASRYFRKRPRTKNLSLT